MANITSAKTPTDLDRAGAKWYRHFSDNYYYSTSMTSTPIITETRIYVVNADVLYELDLDGNILRTITLIARMNSVCHPVLNDDKLYIPIAGGVIQCVDIETFTIVWTSSNSSDSSGNTPSDDISASMGVTSGYQSLCPLVYYNGYLYTGTWKALGRSSFDTQASSDGVFYCIDASTGDVVWTYHDEVSPCGFYWNSGVVYGDAIWFCAEDGRLISHSLTTDLVYGEYKLDDDIATSGLVRCGLTLDISANLMSSTGLIGSTGSTGSTASMFTASKQGKLYKITVDRYGGLKKIYSKNLFETDSKNTSCTCTPTVYKDRLYIGCYSDGCAYMCIRDTSDLSSIADIKGKSSSEIKSSPVISTFDEANGNLYLYFTSNDSDGALYMMRDTIDTEIYQFFTPAKDKQFCIASVSVGSDGTLYYSNDSGTLFAISEVSVSADSVEDSTKISVKKPSSVKVNIKKNKNKIPTKAVISWKNKNKYKKSQTEIYIKIGNKSWKKLKTTSKSKYTLKLSKYKNKKVYIRLRSKVTADGKVYRSGYSKKLFVSIRT